MSSQKQWSNEGMQDLIEIINRLQDAFAFTGTSFGLDLPQIAVVGGQSAGKSSVLENFVGKTFLPRGAGIVTRRPLILQLIHSDEEYGQFLHLNDRRFTDFNEIRNEIEAETKREAGDGKRISNVPINLQIHSPHVVNLTLVDLPGLTRVAVGDQPKDIEKQIREIILSYIKKSSCLILAVTAANQDLATSDALKIADEVDPDGLRTIGVLTKLDLMDKGTDARDILDNKQIPLLRGYIGVVNRSQKDIDNSKQIQEALDDEKKFFLSHPAYRSMADRQGTSYLQKALNQQLTNHIRSTLPKLKDEFRQKMILLEKEVRTYKDEANNSSKTLNKLLHQLRVDFGRNVLTRDCDDVSTDKLSSGARIHDLFHKMFPQQLAKTCADSKELREIVYKKLEIAIKNAHAIREELFAPQIAFETVTKQQISKVEQPFIDCLHWVAEELTIAADECCQCMNRFPRLQEKSTRIIKECIVRETWATEEQIKIFIEGEMAYINTYHEDLVKPNPPVEPADETTDEEEIMAFINLDENIHQDDKLLLAKRVRIMKNAVETYFAIVLKKVKDQVPKTITNLLINRIRTFINEDLTEELVRACISGEALMEQRADEVERRKKVEHSYESVKEALKIIGEVDVSTMMTLNPPSSSNDSKNSKPGTSSQSDTDTKTFALF